MLGVRIDSIRRHEGLRVDEPRYSREFEFEGTAKFDPPAGPAMKILGDLVPVSVAGPTDAECVGDMKLVNADAPFFLGLTLCVDLAHYNDISSLFTQAFASHGNLELRLQLEHPRGVEPEFWRSAWRSETVLVSRFDVWANSSRRRPSLLERLFP